MKQSDHDTVRAAAIGLGVVGLMALYATRKKTGGEGGGLMDELLGKPSAKQVPGGGKMPGGGGGGPVLKKGSKGPEVVELQTTLVQLGFDPKGVDGIFGANTEKAVIAFQKSVGLSPSGIVDGDTRAALGMGSKDGGGPFFPDAPSAISDAMKPGGGKPEGASSFFPDVPEGGMVDSFSMPASGAFEGTLPPDSTPSREQAILQAVIQGNADTQWVDIVSEKGGHKAVIPVMARALRLKMPDGSLLRVSTNFKTAQEIANQFGASLLTSKVSDLIWQQADLRVLNSAGVPPSKFWQGPGTDNSGSKTFRMIEQSKYLDSIVPVQGAGLVANEGKDWVITKRNWNDPSVGKRKNGANFGWYYKNPTGSSKSPGGLSVVQSIGLMHDMSHVDYSQLVRLMGRSILIDDKHQMDVADVLRDPKLAPLLSDEGTLPDVVHPSLGGQAVA